MDQERIYKEMHELEGIIGYTFNNIQHLADAMNATKCNNPNRSKNNDEHMNHSLATVGDAILKAINAELLFQEGKNRGDITIQKSEKENNDVLFEIANKSGITQFAYHQTHFLKDNPPKEALVSNSKHNQYIEAIIGAIFHDGGFDSAFKWVSNWLITILKCF